MRQPEDLRSRGVFCETGRGMSVRRVDREGDTAYFGCGEARGRFVIVHFVGDVVNGGSGRRVVVYERPSLTR